MNDRKRRMPEFAGKLEKIELDNGGTLFRLENEEGKIAITRYKVFPGIDLIYNDVHISCSVSEIEDTNRRIFEIDHCREGRLECQVGEDYFYLAPGDICIHKMGKTVREEIFPASHYHGITIQVDLEKCPTCLSCFLEHVDVEPVRLAEKYHLEENFFFALRQMPAVEHIFSELYEIQGDMRKGYLEVKILELFLFLDRLKPEENRLEQRCLSKKQAALAKEVCHYLTAHIEENVTMAELAEHFGVSVSWIKSSFSGVYGITVSSYVRGQRMHAAAKLLQQTDRTVFDIAGQFGYENASKFASAFRSVMGVTPAQYRKEYHI